MVTQLPLQQRVHVIQTGHGKRRYNFGAELNTRAHETEVRQALAYAEEQEATDGPGVITSALMTLAILCGTPSETQPKQAQREVEVNAAVVVPSQIQTSEPVKKPPALTKTRKQRGRKLEQTPVYLTHTHLPLSERFLMYKLPLSPEQVAAEVDVVRDTVYRWIRAGTLPSRPAGRFYKCDQGPLAGWAKKREFLPADQREDAS